MSTDLRFGVHDLLQLRNIDAIQWEQARPAWSSKALHRAPWVVVRRVRPSPTLLPVGVRGDFRHQRSAAWLPVSAVQQIITPQTLARKRAWYGQPRTQLLPALLVLDAAAAIFEGHGYGDRWGPGGSVGFELASGVPSVSVQSDLDVVLGAPEPIEVRDAAALFIALSRLSARIDLLLETPAGAVALSEYAGGKRVVMLRTPSGARLVADPWRASWTEAMLA